MLHSLSLKFSDNDIQYAMDLLKVVSPQWSKVPRLYVVLKTIDRLGDIEAFVVQGITDKWFPFTITSFPNDIDLPTRRKYLENQWIVLTKAIDLEEGDKGTHQYFAQGETIPLESKGLLGQGSFGKVDSLEPAQPCRICTQENRTREPVLALTREHGGFRKGVSGP
jgi:hypothetical protein